MTTTMNGKVLIMSTKQVRDFEAQIISHIQDGKVTEKTMTTLIAIAATWAEDRKAAAMADVQKQAEALGMTLTPAKRTRTARAPAMMRNSTTGKGWIYCKNPNDKKPIGSDWVRLTQPQCDPAEYEEATAASLKRRADFQLNKAATV